MQFQKDIFISYAHIDNESLTENQQGWITDFQRALDIRLAQLMGRKAIIWRDPKLQGNHIFDKQIADQFAQVAVMISIISPRYVRSEWCIRELNEFYQVCQHNIGYSLHNKIRIFKVVKTPVPVEQHPMEIRNILGYEFYNTDVHTGRVREYAQAFGQQTEWMYWEKMNDLVHDISSFLQEIDLINHSVSPFSPKIASNVDTPVSQLFPLEKSKSERKIYLAESAYDIQPFRESIKRELQDNGYQVYPDRQLPLLAPLLLEEVNQLMGESDLAIHLVGENYGIVPEGTSQSIIELQNEVGAAFSASKELPRLIWIPEGCEPADERQTKFIEKLSCGKEATGADFIIGSLEDIKIAANDVLKVLKEKKEKNTFEKAPPNQNTRLIYLICDSSDLDTIQPLEDFLFSIGHEVVKPVFEGDESQIREDHLESLRSCDAAIIFFGHANELWLRSKMRDLLKINGYGRQEPLITKAVYLAGPVNVAKQRFRTLEAEIINGIDHLPEQHLKNLLSKKP